MSKYSQLLELARLRQNEIPKGYKGIGEYHNGIYECNYVSPYTKSAGNVDADIMFILQDWSSDKSLSQPVEVETVKYGHTPRLPTNKNLKNLLKNHFEVDLSKTYGTNLFPFIKPGKMTAGIPTRDLINAAKKYTIPQIKIIKPKLVICLGAAVYNSIRLALGMQPESSLANSISKPFNFYGAKVWAPSHPGGLGRANRNRGKVDRVSLDWSEMADNYHR